MKTNRRPWGLCAIVMLLSGPIVLEAAPDYMIGNQPPDQYQSPDPENPGVDVSSLLPSASALDPLHTLAHLSALTAQQTHGAITIAQAGTSQDSSSQKQTVTPPAKDPTGTEKKVPILTPASFQSMDGHSYQIPDSEHATVVIYMSITCPIAVGYSAEVNKIYEDYKAKLREKLRFYVVYVYIGSENPSQDFSLGKAKTFTAKTFSNRFPTFFDADGTMANKLKAMYSPEAVVIDAKGIVRYRGRIDDRQGSLPANNKYVRRALNNIVAGDGNTEIMEYVRPIGCTIIPVPQKDEKKK